MVEGYYINLIMSSYYQKTDKSTNFQTIREVIKIEFKRLTEIPPLNPSLPVKVTEMGNVLEVQYMSRRNGKQTIKMLEGGDTFLVCSTGEIKQVQHHETRKDNKKGLYKTFAKIRALINANVVDVSKVRWCTLTYEENMRDAEVLYEDFRKFNQRFQYYCERKGYGKPEYIVVMEPQGRGAWHAHLLYIWNDMQAPYIANEDLRSLWGHGFVRIKKLDNIDNVGAYLTAYLGDMEVSEVDLREWGEIERDVTGVKVIDDVDDEGKPVKKQVLKGARLHLYPANFNMFRCSRGVRKPTVEMMSQEEANKKVLGAAKTFESAIKLVDSDGDFETVIVKKHYNKLRRMCQ